MSDETLEEELVECKDETSKKKKKKDVIAELEDKCAELNEKYLYALAQMKDLHKTYEKLLIKNLLTKTSSGGFLINCCYLFRRKF